MIAGLFPGQGSHSLGMARDFYEHSAAAKAVLDRAETALPGLLKMMWDGPEDLLTLTANQQPALVAAGAAAFAAYREAGGTLPSYAAGHSLGEFTAHVAAGTLRLEDAIILVQKRGTYMQEAVPEGVGAMAAILKSSRDAIDQVCQQTDGLVELANLNSPAQTVISGEAAAVKAASEALQADGARVVPLNVSAPFHCALMKPAALRLASDLAEVRFNKPSFDIVCNVTARVLASPEDAADLLERQVTAPVRWVESVQQLRALGVTRFIEFGSGKVLTGLVGRILDKPEAHAVTDTASLGSVL